MNKYFCPVCNGNDLERINMIIGVYESEGKPVNVFSPMLVCKNCGIIRKELSILTARGTEIKDKTSTKKEDWVKEEKKHDCLPNGYTIGYGIANSNWCMVCGHIFKVGEIYADKGKESLCMTHAHEKGIIKCDYKFKKEDKK